MLLIGSNMINLHNMMQYHYLFIDKYSWQPIFASNRHSPCFIIIIMVIKFMALLAPDICSGAEAASLGLWF